MNKTEIKSAISIEFALSIKEAGRIVDSVFDALEDSFKKDKNFEIRKFGKFNLLIAKIYGNMKYHTISFTPSKKLSKRANYNFENLKKVKIPMEEKNELEPVEPGYNFPKDFVKQIIEKSQDETEVLSEEVAEPVKDTRTLIPDNLVKLHKEITEDDEKESNEKNLWG